MKTQILLLIVTICSLAGVGSADDVEFYLHSKYTPTGTKYDEVANAESLGSDFNPEFRTFVLIHGYNDDRTADSNLAITSAILARPEDVNVVVVDWGAIAKSLLYANVVDQVPVVGNATGIFVQNFIDLYGYSPDDVTLCGFSLGAHVAGIAGAYLDTLGNKPGQIIAMDPAAPGYELASTMETVDPTDGQYVTVYHGSGVLGMTARRGHSDFYFNGGIVQPGCISEILVDSCSHNRVWKYYAESLSSDKFVGRKCSSTSYFFGTCRGPTSVLGGLDLDTSANGRYYLRTASTSPYALGP